MAVTEGKDLQQLKNRLIELADKAYTRNCYTYTPFLGLAEQQAYYAVERETAYAGCRMEGGSPLCERKIIRFGDPGYEEAFPIAAVRIFPKTPKFAENLTHRDFLGAVMNLGIERDVVGDLFVDADKERGALLFCHENIAGYLMENLERVRHTNVACKREEGELALQGAEPERITLTAASARTDGVIAKLYHLSRSDSQELFRTGRIFVNGILAENEGRQLKEGDAVTVRGFGKFIFYGAGGVSKKGKERLSVGVYGLR
ncbi:MAG: YlmH/Sll1252 family protein [Bacteroidales bacterium]|nr:YlmH/Sll1252 family protein [Bacteroidales bacterium]MCM1414311.1 YlmH/Sll1252 family protein [bacterium]MCM1422191.1 YlmH/Sll1252 family protein [bacterium]